VVVAVADLVLLDQLDHKVMTEFVDRLVHRVIEVMQVHRDQVVQLDRRVLLVQFLVLVVLVVLVVQDCLEIRDLVAL
jgi:hypothetical protein